MFQNVQWEMKYFFVNGETYFPSGGKIKKKAISIEDPLVLVTHDSGNGFSNFKMSSITGFHWADLSQKKDVKL